MFKQWSEPLSYDLFIAKDSWWFLDAITELPEGTCDTNVLLPLDGYALQLMLQIFRLLLWFFHEWLKSAWLIILKRIGVQFRIIISKEIPVIFFQSLTCVIIYVGYMRWNLVKIIIIIRVFLLKERFGGHRVNFN